MDYQDLLTSFVNSWNFARNETIEILMSLNDKQLQYKPKGKRWQPLYWEFGCLGRTQIVYTEAIKTGKMDFSLFGSPTLPKKTDNQTQKSIKDFLEKSNRNWVDAIELRSQDENFREKWPDTEMPLIKHIASLAEHERLHHGQFISYFTIGRFELPKSFKSNWAL